jgi:hypothetical protein
MPHEATAWRTDASVALAQSLLTRGSRCASNRLHP